MNFDFFFFFFFFLSRIPVGLEGRLQYDLDSCFFFFLFFFFFFFLGGR